MKFKEKLKDIWQKAGKALVGAPPVNSMTCYDVRHIQKKVKEQTEFDVLCMDSRLVNGRKNVGIIMPQTTPPEKVAQAEDVFIAAAKERGIELDHEQVVHYAPGGTFVSWRIVAPQPKTW